MISVLRSGTDDHILVLKGPSVAAAHSLDLTPQEADELLMQLSRVRHTMRNEVTGQVYEMYSHVDGEIITSGYYAIITRKGDNAELGRSKLHSTIERAKENVKRSYGRSEMFFYPDTKPDLVSFAKAEREQLLYLAQQAADEAGITLTQLIHQFRQQEKENAQ